MSDSSRDPRSANLFCPICDEPITISINWEEEKGDFGEIYSRWPEMDDDPETIDQHGHCHCDFNKPLSVALASHLNESDRLQQILFPPPEEPIVAVNPRDMTPSQAAQLHEVIVLAETLAFDIFDMVKDTGHKIEQHVKMALHCLATASDLAELNHTRLARLESGEAVILNSPSRAEMENMPADELALLQKIANEGSEGLRLGDLFGRTKLPEEPPSITPSDQAILAIREGQLVRVSREEYWSGVRSSIQETAGRWLDEGQTVYWQIAMREVQRLDSLYPPKR